MTKSFSRDTKPIAVKKIEKNQTFEYGAYFKYKDLQRKLLNLFETLPIDRLGNKGIYFQEEEVELRRVKLIKNGIKNNKDLKLQSPLKVLKKPNLFTPQKTVQFLTNKKMVNVSKPFHVSNQKDPENNNPNVYSHNEFNNKNSVNSYDKSRNITSYKSKVTNNINAKKIPKFLSNQDIRLKLPSLCKSNSRNKKSESKFERLPSDNIALHFGSNESIKKSNLLVLNTTSHKSHHYLKHFF